MRFKERDVICCAIGFLIGLSIFIPEYNLLIDAPVEDSLTFVVDIHEETQQEINKYNHPPLCKASGFTDKDMHKFNESGYWVFHTKNECNSTYSLHSDVFDTNKLHSYPQQNCIGEPLYDRFLNRYASYRKKHCIYKHFTMQEALECIQKKHKRILVLGDSIQHQIFMYFFMHFYWHKYGKHDKKPFMAYINYTFSGEAYINWYDVRTPSDKFQMRFIGLSNLRRTGPIPFLSGEWMQEIVDKYFKYPHLVYPTTKEWMKVNNITHGDVKTFKALSSDKIRNEIVDYLKNGEPETVIFNDVLHSIEFWRGFGWKLDKMNDSLSFDWKMKIENEWRHFMQILINTKSVKNIYYSSSYMPPIMTSCGGNVEHWREFTDFVGSVFHKINVNISNKNVKHINYHDVGSSHFKYYDTRYSDNGCHFAHSVFSSAYFNAVINDLCSS